MILFRAVIAINVLFVVGIFAIAIYTNIIQADLAGSVRDWLLVIPAVLFFSIPNMLSVGAVPPKFKLTKTAIVLNAIYIFLFGIGLIEYEQEQMVIYWAATVISICAINIAVLITALARKREFQSESCNVAYP